MLPGPSSLPPLAFPMDTLLLVDDDPGLLHQLQLHFEASCRDGETLYRVVTANHGAGALARAADETPALVLLDMMLPDRDGVSLIPELRAAAGEIPIVVMTAHRDMASTIRAMKAGAFDYLHKPVDPDLLDFVVRRALEMNRVSRLAAALAIDAPDSHRIDDIVSESPRMERIVKEIGKIAASRATVLLHGETGTGKELIARVIHTYSCDEPRPFVAVNCSAIVDTLLESELFGHERGAFTGAVAKKPGKFEVAEDGTIFLDEIGDMSLALQAKILRVLQEREFERVGGVQPLRVRARVVAATHRDLGAEVAAGRFRADLHQRLKVVTLELPPLRERREDIPKLVTHLLVKINEKVRKRVTRVPPEVMEYLASLPWPGNVRELENALMRAVVLSPGEVLSHEYLPGGAESVAPPALAREGAGELLPSLDEVERNHIARVYSACRGHKGKTCDVLRISRPTLERKLRKYGLPRVG